ncbi:hypothetical protein VTN77DRAFT_5163 [Rasamsonia byssochlamydoides]|uniref:uncharacterized protein n=1 Tax=Rasamsonia byssochlamydoides TaxID=89139 RepID=UPI003742D867
MKLAAIILSFLGLAVATPTIEVRGPTLTQRDLGTFTSVIANIDTQVKAFDSQVQSYTGGDATSLLDAAGAITTAANQGVNTINDEPQLSESDALELTGPVGTLTTDIQNSINDLIAKKAQIVAAGAGGQFESSLQAQQTAATNLANAISSKVPSELSTVAQQLASGIADAIQKGVDAFQGTGTSSSTTGGSSATSTATPTATSGGSSATSTTVASTTAAATSASSSAVVSSGASPSSSAVAPSSPSSGLPVTPTSSGSAPLFTGAAAVKGISGPVGVVAALAAVLAF